ncbi:AHH domain-containing protein [Novosphingobium sp. YJ-S2-02]|uniref:AHH domain-containing protein n=1 Tax=Novosphingobium aureum TaxID=2792964 RepID=A0A931HBN0_9SPHN|nr:AHH domain-containing protein [Novosphingobium aureum]MBH0113052.1 AHH domain-containing protein [Novosphingobium aureum]
MRQAGTDRRFLPFRAVNAKHRPGHDPGLQRHHLLPRQLLGKACFVALFEELADRRQRFEDFRENGLLLPCNEAAAMRLALPMHRGPHRRYSELVIERVGQIEAHWARSRATVPERAASDASMRLALLQRALRRYLLEGRGQRAVLNRHDVPRREADFAELDAMVEGLWTASGMESGGGFLKAA